MSDCFKIFILFSGKRGETPLLLVGLEEKAFFFPIFFQSMRKCILGKNKERGCCGQVPVSAANVGEEQSLLLDQFYQSQSTREFYPVRSITDNGHIIY